MTQKYIRCCITVVIIMVCSIPVYADINVLFLPESGFLRVEGSIAMVPQTTRPSLLLFPNAQITMMWVDGLQDYKVERGTLGTIVTLVLPQDAVTQELSFSYEGFLEPEAAHQIPMDRDTMWFPEFSFPTDISSIKLKLPLEWNLVEPKTADVSVQDDAQIVTWKPTFQSYPEFVIARETDPADPEEMTAVVQPSTHEFTTNLTEEIHFVEVVEVSDPNTETYKQELRNILTYFDELLNKRNRAEIELILSNDLVNEGLGEYLAALPLEYKTVHSEITSMHAREKWGTMQTIIYTDNVPRFQAVMTLERQDFAWYITQFSMSPYTPTPPPELEDSIVDFAEKLREAVERQDSKTINQFLSMEGAARDQACEFLLSVNPEVSWNVRMISNKPYGFSLLIHHSPRTSLIINLQLTPDAAGWKISSLDAFPK